MDDGRPIVYNGSEWLRSYSRAPIATLHAEDLENMVFPNEVPTKVSVVVKALMTAAPDVSTRLETQIHVDGMCCAKEAELAKRELEPLNGVYSVCAQVPIKRLVVSHNELVSPTTLIAVLNTHGLDAWVLGKGVEKRTEFHVGAMCCGKEAGILHQILEPLEGVYSISPDVPLKKVTVVHDKGLPVEALIGLMNNHGLAASVFSEGGCTFGKPATISFNLEEVSLTTEISVKGMCSNEAKIIRTLDPVPGVSRVCPNLILNKVVVTHDGRVSPMDLVDLLICQDLKASLITKSNVVTSTFRVDGMCCASEARIINSLLSPISGIETITPNVILKKLTVKHSPEISCQEIARILNENQLGVQVTKDGNSSTGSPESRGQAERKRRDEFPPWYVLIAVVLLVLSFLQYVKHPTYMQYFKYVALGSIALCLPKILLAAFYRLKAKKIDINILMAVAAIGAIALGEYSEAAAVVTLFSLSGWLESRATSKVRVAVDALMKMSPETAVLAQTDVDLGPAGTKVSVDSIHIGTRLSVAHGDYFPIDGTIALGDTYADESMLTGESRPVHKALHSDVYGGTVNVGSYVEIETTTLADDSSVARMVRLIEEANSNRAPTEMLVDKVATIYTPVVILAALLMATIPWAFGTEAGKKYVQVALVLLVVSCPCSLVISTPITYVCGLANAASKGILVKGGCYLEALAKLDSIAMDKTGTLTKGRFSLVGFQVTADQDESRVLKYVFEAEKASFHPIANALKTYAEDRLGAGFNSVPLQSCETLPGEGIVAFFVGNECCTPEEICCDDAKPVEVFIGNTRMAERLGWNLPESYRAAVQGWEREGLTAGWVGSREELWAIFSVGDEVRPEAKSAIRALEKLGIKITMLTGDNPGAAAAVSAKVGIDEFHASLLPQDKVDRLNDMPGTRGMCGDGVNDALCLATAEVSMALGCIGSAVALETADVALMDDNLEMIAKAVRLGRRCRRKIIQNITFSIVTKVVVVIVTLVWFPSLWLAIGFDVGGMLLVSLNSMTILPRKSRKKSQPVPMIVVESEAETVSI
mmetsp:Transcript_10448/g.19542  ORF Transcript_10448/g.19542 Transcript_10448/m.19542 type:complete len:1047 (-) Transcript_10448:3537-6677(-)